MRAAATHLHPTPEQSSLIDRAAALLGKSPSDFILDAAQERAVDVVLDQVLFVVSTDTYQRVEAILNGQPEPSAGLRRLMTLHAPWTSPDK